MAGRRLRRAKPPRTKCCVGIPCLYPLRLELNHGSELMQPSRCSRLASRAGTHRGSVILDFHLPPFLIHQTYRSSYILKIANFSPFRSEESRGGQECVSTFRSRWSQYHEKKKKGYTQHLRRSTY